MPTVTTPTVLSHAGAAFIAGFEGFSGKLYNDPAGHCTIGYGHLVHKGNCNGSEPAAFTKGLTKEEALTLLKTDAQTYANAVRGSVTVPLNQAQFDALVSWTYNLGAGNLKSSTMLKKLNAGDYASVPAEMARWNKAGGKVLAGLVRRRESEGRLFATGAYAS